MSGTVGAAEGYANVHVRCADGTLGWPEEAPFDGIVVAAGGPRVPESLREQLSVGGRLCQSLLRIPRIDECEFRREDLGGVCFVPLIGREGWDWHGECRGTH